MSRAKVKDKRRAQLIQAALDSIAKRGLAETTITHIAAGAGMSRGIINFYFKSKEMLLREALHSLIEEYEAEWRSVWPAPAQEDPLEQVRVLAGAHFNKRLCSARRLAMMSAYWGHAASQSAYRLQLEASDAAIEDALTQALAQLLQSPLEDARRAAHELHALIRGLWLKFMLNPKDVAREALLGQCLDYVHRLAGAPVRIVAESLAPAQAKDSAKAAKSPRKARSAEPQQLDIEDLFSRRA